MYFPYLRGRQFELLALRELIDNKLLSDNIIPIIEPVKLSSTLLKTLETFINNEKKVVLICNPAVGGFSSDMNADKMEKAGLQKKFYEILSKDYIIKGRNYSEALLPR